MNKVVLEKGKSKFNNIPVGIILGLLTPLVIFLIFYLVQGMPADMSLHSFIFQYSIRNVLPNILSLCAIPNLLIFWLFLQKGNYLSSKGIIIAIFILLIWVIIEKVI